MAVGRTSSTAVPLLLLALAAVPAFAANYDISWSNGGDYSSWASDKTIKVGDTVTFQYVGGMHSVDEVNKADYDACSTSNTLSSDGTGNTVITLSQAGTRYFICGTSGHCGGGMKIAVPVSAGASTPSTPSTPSATPSTPSATPSAPSGGGSGGTPTGSSGAAPAAPKSSKPSAAAGFQPGTAVTAAGAFLAGALALLG